MSSERIGDELIDELLAGASTEEEIAGPGGLLAQLTKRLVERAMEVEKAGWQYSIGVRMQKPVRAGVEAIAQNAWTKDRRLPRRR